MRLKHLKTITFLAMITLLASCNLISNKETTIVESSYLMEANKNFTYNGNPINPFAIKELLTSHNFVFGESPAASVKISFFADESSGITQNDGYVYLKKPSHFEYGTEINNGFIRYKWLGSLENGIHVIKFMENGGGTGTWIYLLCAKFSDKTINHDGEISNQLILTTEATYFLGERVKSDVLLDSVQNTIKLLIIERMSDDEKLIEIKF